MLCKVLYILNGVISFKLTFGTKFFSVFIACLKVYESDGLFIYFANRNTLIIDFDMNDKNEIEKGASERLIRYFDLVEIRSETNSPFEYIQEKLTKAIEYFMAHDIEKLLNILYRIDVAEKEVREAMLDKKPAECLSKLVILRELQKAETRIKYRNNNQHGRNKLG